MIQFWKYFFEEVWYMSLWYWFWTYFDWRFGHEKLDLFDPVGIIIVLTISTGYAWYCTVRND